MRRKLIKQGNSALTLTVPRRWTESLDLEAGDEVEVIQGEDNSLLISTERKKTNKQIEFFLEDTRKNLIRTIVASAYKTGNDIIKLNCKVNPSILKRVYDIVNNFTGLEIVEHTTKSITIQCYLQESKESCEKLIHKMFHSVRYQSSLMINSPEEAILLHKQTNHKLRDHILRAIKKTNYGEDKTYDYYDLITALEKLSAAFSKLSEEISTKKIDINLKEEISKLEEYFSDLQKSFQAESFKKSYSTWTELGSLQDKILNNKKTYHKKELYYYQILRLYRHISSRILSLRS